MHPVHTGRLKKMIERQSESDSCAVSCHNKLAALKVSSGVRFKSVTSMNFRSQETGGRAAAGIRRLLPSWITLQMAHICVGLRDNGHTKNIHNRGGSRTHAPRLIGWLVVWLAGWQT
ncbi:hypothetical protein LSAT2_016474 [Lamellibrachia satsuma]|nr:hypothetical protein LSAT2_016474 [Lamellibrachia satsuma]